MPLQNLADSSSAPQSQGIVLPPASCWTALCSRVNKDADS